jgi:uncharacterized protein (DUF4415 family)
MNTRAPLIDEKGEVRELSADDMRQLKPASEVISPEWMTKFGKRTPRGPQKAPVKVPTTIRLSPDVVEAFRAAGDGWQTRIDAALKDWLRTHSPG